MQARLPQIIIIIYTIIKLSLYNIIHDFNCEPVNCTCMFSIAYPCRGPRYTIMHILGSYQVSAVTEVELVFK